MSWLRYSGKGNEQQSSGSGDWRKAVSEISGQIKDVRVLAAGRKTFYGLSSDLAEVEKKIPFKPGCYQIRTVAVPALDGRAQSHFFAVASNSMIETISSELRAAGLHLSSLEVPATVLSRRAERLKEHTQTLLQVHVGHKYTQFLLSFDGYPYVAREIGYGLRDFGVQYSTHLKRPPETALKELETHVVLEPGPVEPAVVKLLEQASRTTALFPSPIDTVSVLGPGALQGLQTRFARHLQASELSDSEAGSPTPMLVEVADS